MNITLVRRLFVQAACLLSLAPLAHAADAPVITAVFSRVHDTYTRQKNADGSYKHETYIVAKGGYIPGLDQDASIDPVPFSGIMRTMAPYLAKQNYLPARDGKKADLMLVVYWGTTKVFDTVQYREFVRQTAESINDFTAWQRANSNGSWVDRPNGVAGADDETMISNLMMMNMANRARDQANERNANLLGYVDEINYHNDLTRYASTSSPYYDLVADLEEPRYYVVIAAYDFQDALHHNQKKLLWSTRVSIRAAGNRFDERLAAMLANASRYFGQASGHLVRRFERTPRVDYGELKSLGVVTDDTPSGK
jgi:hypothetical protein